MQFGKSVELDKDRFFEGVKEYSLKQKVDAIKVYGVKMDNGETRVAFHVEAVTPLEPDEWKKLNSLFQQQYNIETLKESLSKYYDSLRKEGTEPYNEIIEADKKSLNTGVIMMMPDSNLNSNALKRSDTKLKKGKCL